MFLSFLCLNKDIDISLLYVEKEEKSTVYQRKRREVDNLHKIKDKTGQFFGQRDFLDVFFRISNCYSYVFMLYSKKILYL